MKHFLPQFIQEKHRAGERHGRLQACTMFIDLSGFTRLTEKLMKKGAAGAEELSLTLNQIFQPTVALVYEQGGFIPYFAGDSFTAIFPEKTLPEGMASEVVVALKVIETAQATLRRFMHDLRTDDLISLHDIGIKIGLSQGEVEWGIVGERRKSFYFRGEPIDGCSQAQVRANSLEVVCDERFFQFLQPLGLAAKGIEQGFFKLDLGQNKAAENAQPKANISPQKKWADPDLEVLAEYLPPEVLYLTGLGEFRSVVSIFLSFTGVERHEELDKLATVVLDQSLNFSAYFKEIEFGDKGGVMVILLGAPVSFENNLERALEFVAAVQDDLQEITATSPAEVKIGIALGIAFTGIIGADERCQYAAVGARVNLGARLMSAAKWGEVVVDEMVQRNRNFKFNFRGELRYKGFENPIPSYLMTGRILAEKASYSGNYIGRESDFKKLMDFAQPFREGRFGGFAYVFGEAGIGKSRFCYEIRRQLREGMSAVSWFTCSSDQILRKPFNPFIHFLKNYFEQSPENTPARNREIFEANFLELMYDLSESKHPEAEAQRREIARTQTVLAALIGIHYPGSLWEQLDARGRYQNTFSAMTALLVAESLLQPVVLELEDGHWYDDMSREFLATFARRMTAYPIFPLVSSRYDDDGEKSFLLKKNLMAELDIWGLEIDLNYLQPADLKHFAEARLGGELHPELLELLQRMTQGNPFYLEQMADYFREMDYLTTNNGLLELKNKEVQLSDNVKQIMMARIDRLSNMVKETVKAAAVIGREFELPVLSGVMARQEDFIRQNGDLDLVLKEQIQTAEKWQIWHAMNELRYIFRHSLLREAAYDMQLRTRLRELHLNIAETIEHLYKKNPERFTDLAFHFEQAEDERRTNKYFEKAARFARRNFQNRQALGFYEKLLEHQRGKRAGNGKKLIQFLLQKGTVHELIGEWDAGEAAYREALEISQRLENQLLVGRAQRRLGNLVMLRGNYAEAKKHFDIAAAMFETVHDETLLAKTFGNLGTLNFRQGNYDGARDWFARAIGINRSLGLEADNAAIVANLGLIYMNQGNYDEGIRWLEEQLDVTEQANDRPGLNQLYTNLGIIYLEKGALDSALICLEKGLALAEELGNKLLMTICIGCIGSVHEKKGDFEKAMQHFERDLDLARELGDRQGLAIANGLIGDLLSAKGDFERAIEFLDKNLALSRELNYKKGIAKSLNTLGDTYFFKGETDMASKFYREAIEYAREMGNKLVLCNSLIEQGAVLLYLGDSGAARRHLEEGRVLAVTLGKHDLQFSANVLQARIHIAEGNPDGAISLLNQIAALAKDKREEASAQYELRKVAANPATHRERALELYRELFEETPLFLFFIRIQELETGLPMDPATPLH